MRDWLSRFARLLFFRAWVFGYFPDCELVSNPGYQWRKVKRYFRRRRRPSH